VRDLQDRIRDGSLTLDERVELGVVAYSDVQVAMNRAAFKAMSEVSLEMGGFENYTYKAKAPAAPAPAGSLVEQVAFAVAAGAIGGGGVRHRKQP